MRIKTEKNDKIRSGKDRKDKKLKKPCKSHQLLVALSSQNKRHSTSFIFERIEWYTEETHAT